METSCYLGDVKTLCCASDDGRPSRLCIKNTSVRLITGFSTTSNHVSSAHRPSDFSQPSFITAEYAAAVKMTCTSCNHTSQELLGEQ